MTTTCEIYGLRVRQARLMRRMTAKSVLEAVGWKGARLTRLERSETVTVERVDLEALSDVLRFPVEFFGARPVSLVEPEQLSFRAPKATTDTEKNRTAQFMALAGDFLMELDTRHKLPPVRIDPQALGEDPAAAAAYARQCLGVAEDEPIGDLVYQLERAGVPVLLRAERFGGQGAEDNHSGRTERHLGCSTWVGEYRERPLVALRELDSWERTRWTVAHELGHLMLHTNQRDLTDEHEDQASRFASELLAPYKFAAPMLRSEPSLVNLLAVKDKWGISLAASLTHFHQCGGLETGRYEMLRKQLYTRRNSETGFTWGRTEPGWDDRVPERPRLLSKWIEFGFGVSSAEALSTHRLIWPLDVIREFLAGQRGAPAPVFTAPQAARRAGASGGGVADFAAYHRRRA